MSRSIKGTSGDDVLDYANAEVRGFAGHMTFLTGNGGNDTFVFDTPAAGRGNHSSTITDFSQGDKIDLSQIEGLTLGEVEIVQTARGWDIHAEADDGSGVNIKIIGQGFDTSDLIFAA